MSVAVLVPTGGPGWETWRARAWGHVRDHLERLPYELVVEHADPGQPWRKGRVIEAARARTTAGLLVVHDSDLLVDLEALIESVRSVRAGEFSWATPYVDVNRLDRESTVALYEGRDQPRTLERGPHTGMRGGGVTVVTAGAFDDVGGIDPRFVGWGGEDEAFGIALGALHGKGARHAGVALHLYHPHQWVPARRPEHDGSRRLVERYRTQRRQAGGIRALIAEHR